MSAINEAYRVLSDAARRVEYDRSLRSEATGSAAPQSAPPTSSFEEFDEETFSTPRPATWNPLHPPGPARFPWRLMAVLAVLGTALVLATAAFTDPPSTEPPDGILQVGSCVAVEDNLDVREIACDADVADLVVRRVLPVGSTCPAAYGTYRDRLGLSTVCVVTET